MGNIVITEFVSLDGVMEDPGGAEGFKYGGWTFQINRGDDGDKFKLDETMRSDALLLGRVTYEGFAAAWPSREGEFADKFNTMQKYVVSSTLRDPEWTNTTVIAGDLAEAVARIKEAHGGDVVVHGSRQLAPVSSAMTCWTRSPWVVSSLPFWRSRRCASGSLSRSAQRW